MVSVSLVIPCFNEEDGIPQLEEKLLPVVDRLSNNYEFELIFVDDGSTDSTYERLNSAFATRGAKILRHAKNQNLGAATRTGIQGAQGEWVAFLDSDCTYDPNLLEPMLNKMREGSDVVTLSPYHPQGKVEGVAPYRLFLSKTLSFIYRLILQKRVYTYTAMARVYKREIYSTIQSPANDFTAIAEMMLKALSQNYRVEEVPALLSVRRFGESKMKTMRVIRAHLGLIKGLVLRPGIYKR